MRTAWQPIAIVAAPIAAGGSEGFEAASALRESLSAHLRSAEVRVARTRDDFQIRTLAARDGDDLLRAWTGVHRDDECARGAEAALFQEERVRRVAIINGRASRAAMGDRAGRGARARRPSTSPVGASAGVKIIQESRGSVVSR